MDPLLYKLAVGAIALWLILKVLDTIFTKLFSEKSTTPKATAR